MNYWLVKADPDTDYSIDDLEHDGSTVWEGVHNRQAINFIKEMKPDDLVYVYHSQKQKAIVGMAIVLSEPFENKQDPRYSWAVDIKFVQKYNEPLQLSKIKTAPICQDFLLVKNSRLSVMPVPENVKDWLEAQLK